jgi:diguanylate cyclase (GGDEF)-like protein/PAS domain S-box-containing protein
MLRSGRRACWLIALAAFAVVVVFRASGFLAPLENSFADLRARWSEHQVSSDIVIVAMDDASVAKLGSWPWPRRLHAALLGEIAKASPGSVFIDVELGSRSDAIDDAQLESALTRPRDFPIYLPLYLRESGVRGAAPLVSGARARFSLRTESAVVHAVPDGDGLTRRWRTSWWTLDGRRVPSIIDLERRLPDDLDVLIDFSISPASFETVSYVDVLEGRVTAGVLAGRKVFVGPTAQELGDRLAVPLYGSLPGVVVQALAAETVARGAPRIPPALISIAVLAACAAIAALVAGDRGSRWHRSAGFLMGSLALVFALSFHLFANRRLMIETVAPALVLALSIAAISLRSFDRRKWRAIAHALGMRHHDVLIGRMVQSSTDCIICVDGAGMIRTVNPAATRLFDCPAGELVDAPISRHITLFAGEGAGARLAALHGSIRECDARTARGEVFPVEISVSRVEQASSPEGERLFTAIVRDIRERRAQQRRLQHQATHDPLTGLPNRAALLTQLGTVMSDGPMRPVALLMLDLCRFKEVNDTLGHTIGDRVLCEVARRFASALGDNGMITRIGGDEFTVLIDQPVASESLAQTSQALADCLRAPVDVAGVSIEVGVSIGIARYPQDAVDAQSLLRHADAAMYVAKRRGAPYEFHDAAHERNSARNLAIGGELRSAITRGHLELHYQPQVNLRSGLVESCEALMRWSHPSQGLIGPAEFIAIAETTDLIRPLTEWTLACALAQVRAWRERGLHLRMAVNLSARLLQDIGFPARLRELIEGSGVPAASLELEITENALMQDPARALRILQGIDALGTRISIDDFGTGYSSLGYLRDLPAHSLKVDKSFVMGMRDNSDDRIIVESAAQMARALKRDLKAEGVEKEWDARFLKATGYDYAQGFLYSRPLNAEQFLPWALEYNATAMLTAGDTTITANLATATEGFSELAASGR